jgi:UPF0755 protein
VTYSEPPYGPATSGDDWDDQGPSWLWEEDGVNGDDVPGEGGGQYGAPKRGPVDGRQGRNPPDDGYGLSQYGPAQHRTGQHGAVQGGAQDQYAQDQYAQDQYAQGQYAQGQYAQGQYAQDEYAPDQYAQDQYAQEPYAQEPYAQEPYAADPYPADPYPADPYAPGPYAPGPYAPGDYPTGTYPQGQYADGDQYAQPGEYAPQEYAPQEYAPQEYAPQDEGGAARYGQGQQVQGQYPKEDQYRQDGLEAAGDAGYGLVDDGELDEEELAFHRQLAGKWGRDKQRKERKERKSHRVLVAFAMAVTFLLVVAVVTFKYVSGEINPSGPRGPTVVVVVPKGTSSYQIARLLAKKGVIHGPEVFELYLKLEGVSVLQAGTYRLATNQDYSDVVSELEYGPIVTDQKLVVPEGFTIRQIAAAVARLPGVGISAAAFQQAATSGQVRSPYAPKRTDLEGMLFPATYPVSPGDTVDWLVQYMVATFDSHASGLGLAAAAKRLHYSPYQVVIVASIVEREAKFAKDRGPIASAIYNRLAKGMPIGAESTLLYGLGTSVAPPNVDVPNPYNTLINKGFPPSAISNPGVGSLMAAMDPPHTHYLYWVEIKPDGQMGYASTNAGFEKLQRECRKAHLC